MPDYESTNATMEETIAKYQIFAGMVASNLYMAYFVNVPKLARNLAYTTIAITGVGERRTTKNGSALFCYEGWQIIERICHELNDMF